MDMLSFSQSSKILIFLCILVDSNIKNCLNLKFGLNHYVNWPMGKESHLVFSLHYNQFFYSRY
ncbi:hypothetical protein DSECCO2_00910 [anaerobic digester metagenome]